ncbi:MAG: LytTR family DNA-binding domain-containing protein [Cyclobacteriaceae bacterium]
MDVVIVEDERPSADRLRRMISKCEGNIEVAAIIDSVKSGSDWFKENSPPDLMFLDIQLSDGTAFDLLNEISAKPPIIFTTAYDQYAIKAFKFNSVDYLLKPLNQQELEKALEKFYSMESIEPAEISDFGSIDRIITGDFKRRFLVKIGEQYQKVEVDQIAYFQYDCGLTYIFCPDGKKYPIDHTLDSLENMLHPLEFFRINRKSLVSIKAIDQIHSYFNSRLLLKLNPRTDEDPIVSRDRVGGFKRWMDL